MDRGSGGNRRGVDGEHVGGRRQLGARHLDAGSELVRGRPRHRGVDERRRRPRRGIALGVALAGAVFFALDASDASDKVSDLYKHGGKGSDVAAEDERGQRSATLATVLGVGGGLAVVSAGVLYALGRHYENAQHVAIAPHAHGAEVSLSWRF